jgi:hypothetical protein
VTGRPELQRAREWSAALAATLDEVRQHVDAAARRLVDGWPDAHGREWSERLLLLRRSLNREADAAAELGRAVDRVPDDPGPPDQDVDGHSAVPGPRLGGTDARRADDRRGVRIPRLNDPDDGAG